ncbi:MAG: DNA-binding response regulator [Proteobacteria bacterium]|nr:DNA-binding response regulator [Pseudomonadota bacterium]
MVTLYHDLLSSIGVSTRFFSNGEDFFRFWSKDLKGGLIVDLRMPGMSGIEILRRLQTLGSHLPAIVVTGYGEIRTSVQAMKLGAIEFLEKPFANSELIDAVQTMLNHVHQQVLDQNVRSEIEASLSALSSREREVAELIARGLTSREIGELLSISPRTVDAHRAQALIKTNCSTSVELATLFSRFSEQGRH